MKCNVKSMVAIALALALTLTLVYWTLPQILGTLGTFIAMASVLICPLSMLLMMRGQQSHTDGPEKSGQAVRKATRSSTI